MRAIMLATVIVVASSASAQDATTQVLLFDAGGFTARALDALDVPHDTASFADLSAQQVNLFRYGVVISGFDVDRRGLAPDPERLLAFVRNGGVFVGMRHNGSDLWLPSPVERDKAYHPGEILAPDHPMFTTPNEISNETLADVHSGSIYDAFWDLGEGWVGLVSTGREQEWDKREADSDAEHYGIVELEYGEGRIILCQMIPAYDWFNDRGGETGPGSLLIENMIAYALACGPEWSSIGSDTPVPDAYRTDLSEMLSPPDAAGNWPFDGEGWSFEGEGQFSGEADRRSVYTISHPNNPSVAGSFGRVQRTVELGDAAGGCWLRFYMSDDYCGGSDPTMAGDRVASRTMNRKGDMRFAEVTVDGQIVWEQDVLGRNPRPATRRFHTVDISELTRGKQRVTIALQMTDREGSDDAPFATDVFWAGVELLTGIEHIAASALTVEGFALDGDSIALGEGVTSGVATTPAVSIAGEYHLAVRLLDESTGRSELAVSVGGKRVGALTMTADDWGWRWAVFGPTRIPRGGKVALRVRRHGTEAVRISEVTLIPFGLAGDEAPPSGPTILPVCYQPGAQATRASFAVTVTDHGGADRAGEIASHGLPFAYGALRSAENIRVMGPDGVEVPRQVRGLNTWPDGSVMFALVNFPASVAAGQTAEYTVEYGFEVRAQARPPMPALVTEDGDTIRVDTGPLQVTLSKTTGSVFESALLHGREMVAGGQPWAALITDENGQVFSSATDSVTSAQVIEAGPVRVIFRRIGRHKAPDGATLFEYDMIQEFYASSPMTRLRYVFTHKEDGKTERISRVSLRMSLAWMKWGDASSATAWLDEEAGVTQSTQQVTVNQYDLNAARVNVNGQDAAEAGRTLGWARVQNGPGIAVATRWWWEKFPKAITIDAEGITLDLIPEASHTVHSDGPFVQYQGEGIGHEIMIAFEPEGTDATDKTVFQAFRNRLLATPDPAYACDTLALGEVAPRNERMFPRYEGLTDRMHDGYLAKREKRREFGMENFGDDTFEWGYGPVYTFWSDQEYDHQHAFLMQYFRSGDRRFFELGEQAARHQDEVDCYHWAPGREHLVGAPHHHNTKHIVDEGWFPDHCVAGAHVSHAWAEGLYSYWLMTGDVRAGEAARAMSDWFAWSVENNSYGAGGQERGPAWSLISLSSAYRLTGDERYLRACETIVDWFEGMVDPVRGVVSVPVSEQPSYEGGTTFMHGIVGRALGKYYEATNDPRGMVMALSIGEWITTEPMGPPARFWYKQAPACKKGFGATSQVMTALSYPYRYTGDEWFANMSETLFGMTGPSVRSAAWMYMSLGHLAPLRTPLRIEMPGGPVVIAPETPWQGIVKLTNTTPDALTVQLDAGDAEGLSATLAPATVTVAVGESVEVALEISADVGTVGARELTLRMTSGEQVQERTLPVRVVPELVRRELGVDQATLTAPFAMGKDGVRTFAHVPPEVRASDSPWLAADKAGSATWRMNLPVAAEYVLMAECWWRDAKGNSFYARVDNSTPMEIGNNADYGRWQWVKGPTMNLSAGEHTITVLGREDGARVSQVMLTNVGS